MPILDTLNIRDKSIEHNTGAQCLKDIKGASSYYLGLLLSIRKSHKKVAYDALSSNRKIHP